LPTNVEDFGSNQTGSRVDNRNLIDDWLGLMHRKNKTHKFMWNAADLRNLDTNGYDHVLGNVDLPLVLVCIPEKPDF
jgi:hypothetical protein